MTEPETAPAAWPVPNVYTQLAAFQAELPHVAHNATAKIDAKEEGKRSFSYGYAGLDVVSHAALPVLGKHGLAWSCQPDTDAQGRLVMRYELVHGASGTRIAGTWLIAGRTEKAIGSAITYFRRYGLNAVVGVAPAGEDDDADAAVADRDRDREERMARRREEAQGQQRQTTQRTAAPRQSPPPSTAPDNSAPEATAEDPALIEARQKLGALLVEMYGGDKAAALQGVSHALKRDVTALAQLDEAETLQMVGRLERKLKELRAAKAEAAEERTKPTDAGPAAEGDSEPDMLPADAVVDDPTDAVLAIGELAHGDDDDPFRMLNMAAEAYAELPDQAERIVMPDYEGMHPDLKGKTLLETWTARLLDCTSRATTPDLLDNVERAVETSKLRQSSHADQTKVLIAVRQRRAELSRRRPAAAPA